MERFRIFPHVTVDDEVFKPVEFTQLPDLVENYGKLWQKLQVLKESDNVTYDGCLTLQLTQWFKKHEIEKYRDCDPTTNEIDEDELASDGEDSYVAITACLDLNNKDFIQLRFVEGFWSDVNEQIIETDRFLDVKKDRESLAQLVEDVLENRKIPMFNDGCDERMIESMPYYRA
jgi:hypothetical protein